MESAPLNLAHFHERRADRHLKRNRYDEAIKAMEAALAYIEDAYKTTTIPKAIQVLDAEKWDCSRKLKQINMRLSQSDGTKLTVVVPPSESQIADSRQEEAEECPSISIHQAIENFDAKYTSSTLESLYRSKCEDKVVKSENNKPLKNNNPREESNNWLEELESKDFPTLAPLELPAFDLGLDSSSPYENT